VLERVGDGSVWAPAGRTVLASTTRAATSPRALSSRNRAVEKCPGSRVGSRIAMELETGEAERDG
jgi:hypothetical protein